MPLSPSARRGLRACLYLARHWGEGPVGVHTIADAEGITRPFLAKLLHRLGVHGLVISTKGPGGGFELALDPGQVHIQDIVEAFDSRTESGNRCVLALGECDETNPCPLHDIWSKFCKCFSSSLVDVTLADLASQADDRLPD